MKCESCRRRKVTCRFPNGFPFEEPGSRPFPPLPSSQVPPRRRRPSIRPPTSPEIEEVRGMSNQEVRPQRTRPAVNYRIPPILGTPEIEELRGE